MSLALFVECAALKVRGRLHRIQVSNKRQILFFSFLPFTWSFRNLDDFVRTLLFF